MEEIIKELEQLKEKINKELDCVKENTANSRENYIRKKNNILILNNRLGYILGDIEDIKLNLEYIRNHF